MDAYRSHGHKKGSARAQMDCKESSTDVYDEAKKIPSFNLNSQEIDSQTLSEGDMDIVNNSYIPRISSTLGAAAM